MTSVATLVMERIIDVSKTSNVWTDNVNMTLSAILSPEQKKPSTVSIMDLGKMLLACSKSGETAKVHELMSRGAPFTTDWLGTSPLHLAAMNNHLETCEVLLQAGISKDARTKVDRTPLHFAVYEGHTAIVELLLKHKCDVNARDMLKMTPLHWAVVRHYPKLVTLLLKYGGDATAASKFNKTPIVIALETKQNDIFQELIMHNEMATSQQEQQEATNSLMFEMKKDNSNETEQMDLEPSIIYESPENSPSQTIENNISTIDSKQTVNAIDSPTLQILKKHGIAMLPDDDGDNTMVNSALQSGRKLMLSDAGKQIILNYTKTAPSTIKSTNDATTSQLDSNSRTEIGTIKRKASAVVMSNAVQQTKPGSLKTNKVIKILSAEEFNKMCGGKVQNNTTFKKITTNDGTDIDSMKTGNRFAIVNKNKVNSVPTLVKSEVKVTSIKSTNNVPANVMQRLKSNVVVNSPSNVASKFVVKSQQMSSVSSPSTMLSALSNESIQKSSTSSALIASSSPSQSKIALNDIVRQFFELKKQMEELRKQMDVCRKQNDDYRIRIERLENERDTERQDGIRQWANENH